MVLKVRAGLSSSGGSRGREGEGEGRARGRSTRFAAELIFDDSVFEFETKHLPGKDVE